MPSIPISVWVNYDLCPFPSTKSRFLLIPSYFVQCNGQVPVGVTLLSSTSCGTIAPVAGRVPYRVNALGLSSACNSYVPPPFLGPFDEYVRPGCWRTPRTTMSHPLVLRGEYESTFVSYCKVALLNATCRRPLAGRLNPCRRISP